VKSLAVIYFSAGRHLLLKGIEPTTTGSDSAEAQDEMDDKVVCNHGVIEVSILNEIKSMKLSKVPNMSPQSGDANGMDQDPCPLQLSWITENAG
jgi:hypothetical protein